MKSKKVNVLSLFDGMSCGQIALERAGIKVDNYYASEIDKYAIQVTQKNYPNTIQLGSVVDLDTEYLKTLDIDIIIGGSPCQGFSLAGKLKGSATKCGKEVTTLDHYLALKEMGFEFDGQSYLFWEYIRILRAIKPKYFLLENVRVTEKWLPMFNEAVGVEPILINSSLVSAQNRQRYYWTNIPNVEQPADKGIVLQDILEDGLVDRDKSFCLDANYFKGGNLKQSFEKHRRQLVFSKDGLCHVGDADLKGNDSIKTLTTMGGGHREPKVLIVPEATKKGYVEVQPGEGVDLTFPKSKTRRGRHMKDKCNCLTAANYDYGMWNGKQWRKLTPIECERLQTVPDGYTEGVSNTQRYKMLGNGWTVDVIAHIFRGLK